MINPALRNIRSAFLTFCLLTLSACGINSVPTAEEAAKARWADVQAQYQRRADLVPNLVATVKGAAQAERETLTAVIEARAKATLVQVSTDDLNDPAKVAQFAAAQGALSQFLPSEQLQEDQHELERVENEQCQQGSRSPLRPLHTTSRVVG